MEIAFFRNRKRLAIRTLGTVLALGVLTLVWVSPLILLTTASFPNVNWSRLSNIGQTYGAISAFLAGLALIGVALSVLLQLRETRFNRLEAGRTRHYELVRLAMEDPLYMDIFGAFPSQSTTDAKRSIAYINLYLQFQKMLWEFSDISETEVHSQALSLFDTSLGRDYWQRFGEMRLQLDNTRREHEFDLILDSAYKHSVASGPPRHTLPSDRAHPLSRGRADFGLNPEGLLAIATAVAVGAIAGWIGRSTRSP